MFRTAVCFYDICIRDCVWYFYPCYLTCARCDITLGFLADECLLTFFKSTVVEKLLIWHALDALDIRQTWIVRIFNEFLSMKYFCFLFIHQLMTCRKCFSMNEFEIVPNLCFIALKNGELFLHLLLPLSGVWPRFWITNSFVDKVSFNQFMPTKRAAEVKLARKQTGFF